MAVSFGGVAEPLWLSFTNDRGALVVTWPRWATNAVLQQSTVLEPQPFWSSISPALYQSNSASFSYRWSPADGNRFFRVRRLGPPVPGLTGSWELDEGSGQAAADQTSSAPNLSLTNVTWTSGRFGAGSLGFNGQPPGAGASLAWVTNANYQVLPPLGRPFSVSLWFNPESLTRGVRKLIGNNANGSDGWDVALSAAGPGTNYLVLTGTAGGSSLSATGRVSLLPGQWRQLTLSVETNQARLYLDAALIAQRPGSLINHQGPFYFGGMPGFAGFHGRIDDIRAYTNALMSEQISLTGQWTFNENGGDVAVDSSLRNHLASLTTATGWSPGKTGYGVDLSRNSVVIRNDDYGLLPPSGGEFSLSAWILPGVMPLGRSGLFSCAEATNAGWQITVDYALGGSWMEFTSTNLGGTLALRAPLSLTNGQWTKLDVTFNGGIASVYVNGTKAAFDSGAIRGTESPLVVGEVPGTSKFNGVIDDLKVYNRERADNEIGPVAQPLWEMALVNTTTNLLLPGSGPSGKFLTYTIVSQPTRGSIIYSPGLPIISYQAGGQKGPDSFVYTVSDGEFTSPPATGVVSVVAPRWLSPNGGPSEPRDGSTPAKAWAAGTAAALDAIWKTNNYYDCFFYAPGEYQTTGWKYEARSTANPGCKHIGSGSEGSSATVIKLVDTWEAMREGVIFGGFVEASLADSFEVRNMVLDCNAQNNPKYAIGEPVWVRVPLTTTARVDTVSLRWSDGPIAFWRQGRPAEFSLCTRAPGPNGYVTNCLSLVSTGRTDVVTVGADATELVIQLIRRPNDVEFYGLEELQVAGAAVSLPTAARLEGGESRLDAQHSILQAVDENPGTSWASGPEAQARITLPLEPGTTVNQVQFHWNCQTLTDLGWLGPAAQYAILARDSSGVLRDVPFVTTGRSAAGLEKATFANPVVTDQIVILLIARESGVDFFSLREMTLLHGPVPKTLRMPSALNFMNFIGAFPVLRAFDGDNQTGWVSSTQGAVTAIDVRGSHLKFIGLKVIGFGTKAFRECFPLAVFAPRFRPPNSPPLRNILVEDCVFTQPATNNPDGISVAYVYGPRSGTLLNGIIRRCSVLGIGPHFTYSHGVAAPLVENCFVDDCQVPVYFEPTPGPEGFDSVGPVVIRSNLFQNFIRGVALNFHPGGQFESITLQGNEFVVPDSESAGFALDACDVCNPGPSGTTTNITALNNIIRYADWAPRPNGTAGGFHYTDIKHGVFANNLIAVGTMDSLRVRLYPSGVIPGQATPEDCDHPGISPPPPSTYPPSLDTPPPGYRRAWLNNRDLSGVLLPVRHKFYGVDRLATDQQWAE